MKDAALDVVVVNYKTPGDLENFLRSVAQFWPERDCVLHIVNVEPGDVDREVLDAWRELVPRNQLRFTSFSENVGYNIACNTMGVAGGGEIIAFFNADVRVTEGSLDIVCDELMVHDDWAIAGPRQINDRGQLTAGGIFGTDEKPQHRGWKATQGYNDVRDDCTVVCGSALFIKRAAWDELRRCEIFQKCFPDTGEAGRNGAWPPLHHFYGDTGLSYHARGHGYRLGYVGTTTMHHRLHGAGRQNIWTKADRADFRAFLDAHGLEHE